MSSASDRFAKYENGACYSGNAQDILISVRHIAEQMAAHNLTEAETQITSTKDEIIIKLKRKATR